jgi:hypothetical protein
MLFTLWKPYVMFPLNSLVFLPELSLLWWCHLWYFLLVLLRLSLLWRCHMQYYYNLSNYLYHYWHYRWFHSTPHHFLCPQISCSLFTFELEVPLSSTLFFLLRTLLGESSVAFFLFSSVIYISSLVFLTLASGFYWLSFLCKNKY